MVGDGRCLWDDLWMLDDDCGMTVVVAVVVLVVVAGPDPNLKRKPSPV